MATTSDDLLSPPSTDDDDNDGDDDDDAIAMALHDAIADGAFPGAAVAYGRVVSGGDLPSTSTSSSRGYGTHTFDAMVPAAPDSIYDLASLTKVIATATAIAILEDERKLSLDASVADLLGDRFANGSTAGVTVRHLLSHTSGLPAWLNLGSAAARFGEDGRISESSACDLIAAAPPVFAAPGIGHRYSDLGFILLGMIVERVAGQSLDAFASARIFEPLGMHDTGFRPPPPIATPEDAVANAPSSDAHDDDDGKRGRVVPTEVCPHRGRLLWGEVHDANAWRLGGVAGHAGLFSSALDVARYARAMLCGGCSPDTGARVMSPEAAARFLAPMAGVGGSHDHGYGWSRYVPPSPEESRGEGEREGVGGGEGEGEGSGGGTTQFKYRSAGRLLSARAVGHLGTRVTHRHAPFLRTHTILHIARL